MSNVKYPTLSLRHSYRAQIHPGALKATGNRGLQPAMDHILEHDGQSVPELSAVSERSTGGSAPMDVDDDEDMEALTNLGVLKASADAEAKVRLVLKSIMRYSHSFLSTRASNVLNAARFSKTRPSPTSTLKRVDTISSKNRLKK